jgi:hypothetical protein
VPWYPGANAGVSFGTTAPSNPVRGHFWWNGLTLFMFDGAAWVSTAGGGTPPSSTAPANPVPGQQWFNGSTLFVWDGNAWVPVSQTKTFVQSTAPPAPNAGDMWWNGTVMRIWDGSAWELVGPGAFVGPVGTTTQTFAMQQTTALALPASNAWGIVNYSATPLIDTQTAWDSVQHKLTPKVAGMYGFNVRGSISGTDGAMAIVKNDPGTFTSLASSDIVVAASSGIGWNSVYGMSPMNGTSDYVRIWGRDTAGSLGAGGSNPVFSAVIFP